MRIVLLLSVFSAFFLLPFPRGEGQTPSRPAGEDLPDLLARHARDLMEATGGGRPALPGEKEELRKKLARLQEDFARRLRAWRRAHPSDRRASRAAFEEARAWMSLGRDGEARQALEGLRPAGLAPGERLLAAQWLAELGAPASRARPLYRGLGPKDLKSSREKLLLAALLSRDAGREREALALLGAPVFPEGASPDPNRVRTWTEGLEGALPGLPAPLARPLRGLLYGERLRLLPEDPERPRLEAFLRGLRLRPGDPLPRLEAKDLAGRTFRLPPPPSEGRPLVLLFWESRNPSSLAALKELARPEGPAGKGRMLLAAPCLDRRRRDLDRALEELPKGLRVLWDGKAWKGLLPSTFAVDRVPFAVAADPRGRILAAGLTGKNLGAKIEKLLFPK